MRRLASAPILALAVLVIACGTPAPSTAPDPADPSADVGPSLTVERDGVLVTASLEVDPVVAGDVVRIGASVVNVGPGTLFWQAGGCDLLDDLQVGGPAVEDEPVPDPPQGDDPAAIAGLIRWAALVSDVGERSTVLPPGTPPGQMLACTSDLGVGELEPGGVATVEAIWPATLVDGRPVEAGEYVLRFAFPFAGRQPAPPFAGDISGTDPIVVDVPFEVVGEPWVGITPAQAVDAALADARVREWLLRAVDRSSFAGSSVRLVDGRWRIEIRLLDAGGAQGPTARIEVDPATGTVTTAELPSG